MDGYGGVSTPKTSEPSGLGAGGLNGRKGACGTASASEKNDDGGTGGICYVDGGNVQ